MEREEGEEKGGTKAWRVKINKGNAIGVRKGQSTS